MDYSDLYSTVLFFAGTPDGQNAHDDLAQEIARNGRKFAEEHWRWADMESYVSLMYRVCTLCRTDPS